MNCDPDEFRKYVKGFELSRGGQDELIYMLWRYWEGVVDRAWGDDPVQMALEDRGSGVAKDACESPPVVELGKHEYRDLGLSKSFNETQKKKGHEDD